MGILQEIKQLSYMDKLRVVEALWKDLSGDLEERYDCLLLQLSARSVRNKILVEEKQRN